MAIFDYSRWPFGTSTGQKYKNVGPGRVSDVRITRRKISAFGEVSIAGGVLAGRFSYYGNFRESRQTGIAGKIRRITGEPVQGGVVKFGKLEGVFFEDIVTARKQWKYEANVVLANDDVIIGSRFNDRINGRDGDDLIIAGLGANRVKGGNGSDTFRLTASRKAFTIVQDFEPGKDLLDLPGNRREFDFDRVGSSVFISKKGKSFDFAEITNVTEITAADIL